MEAITKEQLQNMKNIDIHTVDPDELCDIRKVVIDPSESLKERIQSYLRQIKNPYCYRCGKYVVKIRYTENGGSISERLESYLRSFMKI